LIEHNVSKQKPTTPIELNLDLHIFLYLSRIRTRILAVFSSLLSIAASFVFAIAVTRKLPLEYLGVLNVYSASIIFGSVPVGIVSFMSPRLSAKYRSIQVPLINTSFMFGLFGALISAIFLIFIKAKIPSEFFIILLVLTVLSVITGSLSTVFNGGLTVFNRKRLVFTSLVTSAVKIASVFYIMYSEWSLQSVMVASFLINLSGMIYALASSFKYIKAEGSFRKTAKEIASGSWVSLLGYASSNIRSIDSFVIASIGGIFDNSLWQVLGVAGSAYSFRGTLFSITYGELLEQRERLKRIYMDFLFVLFTVTAVTLFIIFFEPEVVAFLRPTNLYLIGTLYVPIIIWGLTGIINTVSQYMSNVMQGVERVDFEKEIELKTYWRSLVFYAHFAEFVSTVSYVTLIVPMIFLLKAFSLSLYVIEGVLSANLIAVIVAIALRIKTFPEIKNYIKVKDFTVDYVIPLVVSSFVLFALRKPLELAFPPTVSAYVGLLRLIILLIAVVLVYTGISFALSKRMREIITLVIRRTLSYL